MPAPPGKGLAALTVSAPCEGKGKSAISRAAGVPGRCGIPRARLTSPPPASCAGCPSSRPACWPGAPPLLSPATESRVTGTAGSRPRCRHRGAPASPWCGVSHPSGSRILAPALLGFTSTRLAEAPLTARLPPAPGGEGAGGVGSPCSTPQLYCTTRGGPRCPGTANATAEGSAAPPLRLPHDTQPRQAAHTATPAWGRAGQRPALCQAELHHQPTEGGEPTAVP